MRGRMPQQTQTNVVLVGKYSVYLQNLVWQYANITCTRLFAIQNIFSTKTVSHIQNQIGEIVSQVSIAGLLGKAMAKAVKIAVNFIFNAQWFGSVVAYYCGWTNDLEKRLKAHNEGKGAKYTRARLPVTLVYYETFETSVEAQKREYAIKRLTRTEKLKLIEKQ